MEFAAKHVDDSIAGVYSQVKHDFLSRLAAAVRVVTLWKQAPLPEEGKKKLDPSRKLMQVGPAINWPTRSTGAAKHLAPPLEATHGDIANHVLSINDSLNNNPMSCVIVQPVNETSSSHRWF